MNNILNDLNDIRNVLTEINHDRKAQMLSSIDYLRSISISSQQINDDYDYETIMIELDNKDLLELALQAHEKDVTLNEHINDLLKEYIKNNQ